MRRERCLPKVICLASTLASRLQQVTDWQHSALHRYRFVLVTVYRSLPGVPMSRRTLLKGAVAGAALGLLPAQGAWGAPSFVTRRAVPAERVRTIMGVNTKTAANTGVYQDEASMRRVLAELRISHVRDALFLRRKDQWASYAALRSAGVRINTVLGARPDGTNGSLDVAVQELAAHAAPLVASVEGPNEWNLLGGATWAADLRSHQRRLYRLIKANPATEHLPVVAPSLGRREGHQQLGDLRDACDLGNIHLYAGGRSPSTFMDEQLDLIRFVSGNYPVYVTECGFHTAMGHTGPHFPSSEETASLLMPRLLMEWASRGVPRIFAYELLDQGPSSSDHEQRFGFVRSDGTPKAHYRTMSRLLALLDDPGGAGVTGQLTYAVSGGGADLRHIVMTNSRGEYMVALWRDVEVWQPRLKQPVAVDPVTVRLHLEAPAPVSVFSPSASGSPVSSLTSSVVEVTLRGELQLVRIGGAPTIDHGLAVAASIESDVLTVSAGGSVLLSGAVVRSDSSTPVTAGTVRIMRAAVDSGMPFRDRTREVVTTVPLESRGRWQVRVWPRETSQYQAQYLPVGDYRFAGSRPTAPVRVV
jgi:hypothetical protein